MARRSSDRVQAVLTSAALVLGLLITAGLCVAALQHAHPDAPVSDTLLPSDLTGDPAELPALAPTLAASGPYTSLWLGDRLTVGVGASDVAHRYRDLVVRALEARGDVEVATSRLPLRETAGLEQTVTDHAPVDLAVVELGTDEATDHEPLGVFSARYRKLVKAVRAASPDAALVCLGTWTSPADAAPYDQRIATWCRGSQGTFVSLAGLHDRDDSRGPAGRHVFSGGLGGRASVGDDELPNDTGYAQITFRVLAALDVAP